MSDKTCRNCAHWAAFEDDDATEAPCYKHGYDKDQFDTCPDYTTEAEAAVNALKELPLTETLPLVKEWLAGEGYGIFFADSFDAKTCLPGCLASAPLHGCSLGLHDRRDTMSPGPKCPAMLKAAKDGK